MVMLECRMSACQAEVSGFIRRCALQEETGSNERYGSYHAQAGEFQPARFVTGLALLAQKAGANLVWPRAFYSVTRFPPAGMVKRRKPPMARRVQTTSRVKKEKRRAALFNS